MNNPVLSVVIPVYKVEPYLERCVLSVLNQSYKDIEIILVDDGSPDKCPQICDYLSAQDDRVKVIHKENGGLSSARNAGILESAGDYIAFLDSDDQWKDGALQTAMQEVLRHNEDVAILPFLKQRDGVNHISRVKDSLFSDITIVLSTDVIYKRLIELGDLHESAWSKIIKREFLLRHNLFFKDGIISEDFEWMHRMLRCTSKIVLIPTYLMIYTEARRGSISNTATLKHILDLMTIIETSINYYETSPIGEFKTLELASCSYIWSIALGLYDRIDNKDKDQAKKKMIVIKNKINLRSHPKSRKVNALYTFLGFDLTARICSSYIYLRKNRFIDNSIPYYE